MLVNRRRFGALASSAAISPLVRSRQANGQQTDAASAPLETFVPHRQITHARAKAAPNSRPQHHWFGYYDKQQFDPTGMQVLAHQVDFEGRSPTAADRIRVGYVDTAREDTWVELGTSLAWGWQQGCMLQWVGNKGREVLWNDRQDDHFVCRIKDIQTGSVRVIDRPLYTISHDGRWGLSVDFSRIDNLRPGYGYEGVPDPNVAQRAPKDSGIWRVELETGRSELILSHADVVAIAWPDGSRKEEAWHYFNHLLMNPSATRFVFLHRFRPKFDPDTLSFEGNFVTRMISANLDGSDLYVLDPSGNTSHFIWKDDETVTMWTRPDGLPAGFYEMTDQSDRMRRIGEVKMPVNGHNTYLPPPYQDWILNDTYPDRTGRQTVYLYHPPTDRRVELGHFPSPPAYRGEWRCDTHPRTSVDGMTVSIDSPHEGGRQVHLLDIRELMAQLS